MAETIVWCVIINHENAHMSRLCEIAMSSDSSVYRLAKKVRDENPNRFAKVDTSMLATWKWSGGIDVERSGELKKEIRDFEQREDTNELSPVYALDELEWSSEKDLLVVRLPDPHASLAHGPDDDRYGSPLSKVPEEYREMVIKTQKQGSFSVDDYSANDVKPIPCPPEFVTAFAQKLGRRRKVGREAFLPSGDNPPPTGTTSTEQSRKAVLDNLMEAFELSNADYDANDEEIMHHNLLAHFDFLSTRRLTRRLITDTSQVPYEDIAKAMFIFPFACYLEALLVDRHETRINYGFGTDQWPFALLIKLDVGQEGTTEVNKQLFQYKPKSDFLVVKDTLPRLLVEIYSKSSGNVLQDRIRMLLQAASVVRLANAYVDLFQAEKNFLLMAIYVDENGNATRFILFQKKDSNKVFYTSKCFILQLVEERLKFVRELYNFLSLLADERSSNAQSILDQYKTVVEQLVRKHNLQGYMSRKRLGEEGDTNKSMKCSRGGMSGGAAEHLEAHGYSVIPETLEDDGGGIWEPIVKLPPNIRIVYRASDAKKTELIAKRVRMRSNVNVNANELEIIQSLHSNQSPSPHVINFIDSIVTTGETWVIFPKLCTIADKLSPNSGRFLRGKVEQFSWGLIKGLAYLHENGIAHLDIKPDNLVFDNAYQLKIMDFDIAVCVRDEDEEIEGYRGTHGWTAPEVGEEDGLKLRYSAIKADRWSCGRVLLSFLNVEEGNRVLRTIANRLTLVNPCERPSLSEWPKWVDAAHRELDGVSRTLAMDLDSRVTPRPREWEDVRDGDGMAAPLSKKPRIAPLGACTSRFKQQAPQPPLRLHA